MSASGRKRLSKDSPAAFDNFLMSKYERLAGIAHTRSYPYVMTIDPSTICQLRCPACMTGLANEARRDHSKKTTGARRPARLTQGIIDSIFEECGDTLFYCMFYNWSEPLLHEGLPDFIRAATAQNIRTKFDTNLSLRLSDERIRDVLTAGVGEIAASIDGFSQETYERYRKGGRFELALKNLTRFAAMRDDLGLDTVLTWNFLVFEFNEHEAADVAEYCEQHGVVFNPKNPVVFGEMNDWLPEYRREGKPNPYRTLAATRPPVALAKTPAGTIPTYLGRPEGQSCGWHYGYTTVNGDGGVTPCCALYKRETDFGEVDETPGSFGRVWHNANFEAARRISSDAMAHTKEFPVSVCSSCKRSESFRDHYALLDREIVHTYWSFPEGSDVRQFDELFMLLQKSPAGFQKAYAARYEATPALELA